MMISHGNFGIFIERPVSCALLVATAAFLLLPMLKAAWRRWHGKEATGAAHPGATQEVER